LKGIFLIIGLSLCLFCIHNVYAQAADIGNQKSNDTYTYNTYTHCDGKICSMSIGGSYALDSDGKWKSIENAKSLKNSPVQCHVDYDLIDLATCNDWNLTYVNMSLAVVPTSVGKLIPFRIWNNGTLKNSTNLMFATPTAKNMIVPLTLGDSIEFGQNSTTIILNESNKGNVGDTMTRKGTSGYNTNNYGISTQLYAGTELGGTPKDTFWSLWNLSIIPNGSTITNANLSIYAQAESSATQILAYNASIYCNSSCSGQQWVEGTHNGAANNTCNELTQNNLPAIGVLQDNKLISTSYQSWYWNVTNAAISTFSNTTNQNMSIEITNLTATSYYVLRLYSKEIANTTQRPQLVITYTTGAANSCTYTSGVWNINCADNCVISSDVTMDGSELQIGGAGSLQLKKNINNHGNVRIGGTGYCDIQCNGGCW
jgi:hypothetical protein